MDEARNQPQAMEHCGGGGEVRHMHKLLQGDALKYQEGEERASSL